MATAIEHKLCLDCHKPVKGRTDKKFCDDYCRNNYNNALKSNTINLVRNINNALGKNRRILEALFVPGRKWQKLREINCCKRDFSSSILRIRIPIRKETFIFFAMILDIFL